MLCGIKDEVLIDGEKIAEYLESRKEELGRSRRERREGGKKGDAREENGNRRISLKNRKEEIRRRE